MFHERKPDPLRRAICRYALTASLLPFASAIHAQTPGEPADPRSGSVRIDVSVSTSAMTKIVKGLNKHFPNLKIDFVRAGSIETVKRFVAERQAGLIGADLIHSADPGGFDYFAQKGWIDKSLTDLPLLKDYRDGFYDKAAGWVALRATGIAIMYNTKNVKKEDVPKTWKELADPKWKGRIAISDPNRAGSSFSHLYAMWKIYGPDYLKAFAANDVMVAGDGSATREAIAAGERDIAPVSEYDAFESKKEGKPVDVAWPADGTVLLPAPLALVAGSKNADNAKALAAYMLSQEGQQLIVDTTLTWSARHDVPAPEGKPPLDSIKTVSFDWTKVAAEKGKVLNLYFQDFQAN
jgi:iron(III) transport system substrate-binding protein